jgi:hypothetical protein
MKEEILQTNVYSNYRTNDEEDGKSPTICSHVLNM